MAGRGFHSPAQRRDRSRSPARRNRSRSRSPWRPSKPGARDKRPRDESHYGKSSSDARRFKSHHHQEPSRRDHGANGSIDSHHPRHRDRSRSPFRHSHPDQHAAPSYGHSRPGGSLSATRVANSSLPTAELRSDLQPSSERELAPNDASGDVNAETQNSNAGKPTNEDEGSESQDGEDDTGEPPKLSDAERIEQRRQRRREIRAKYQSNSSLLVKALEQNVSSTASTPLHDSNATSSTHHSPPSSVGSPGTPRDASLPDSPSTLAVDNEEELANPYQNGDANDIDGPSAADYDPNLDANEDRPDRQPLEYQNTGGNSYPQDSLPTDPKALSKPHKEYDMFADEDDYDMFAPDDPTPKLDRGPSHALALDKSLLDNWDHPDGHYRIILREALDKRYVVQQELGKGTFATVVRAEDTHTGGLVAIKIARNNDTMYKAGMKEVDFLQLLNEKDPEDRRYVIRLLRHFNHKGHLCLVFESLSNDLRELLKKFGRNVGISMKGIRPYAFQMFTALNHFRACSVLHADLKPDNILVNENHSVLKICDLGTAMYLRDVEVTPLLVSRYYRAPEIILGMDFEYGIDMWAIGCTLFELYTGKILFAGADNNQMLRLMQECRGKFPNRMIKRGRLANEYFDSDFTFYSREPDQITGHMASRQMRFHKTAPGKDLRSRLTSNIKEMNKDEQKEVILFADLIERCMQLDPEKRLTPRDALKHPFVLRPRTTAAPPTVKPALNPALAVPSFR